MSPQDSRSEIIDLLLKAGANVNARDCFGYTPLLYLSNRAKGESFLVEKLLRFNANPNLASNTGNSALHFAVDSCDLGTVRVLVGYGRSQNGKVRERMDGSGGEGDGWDHGHDGGCCCGGGGGGGSSSHSTSPPTNPHFKDPSPPTNLHFKNHYGKTALDCAIIRHELGSDYYDFMPMDGVDDPVGEYGRIRVFLENAVGR